MSDSGSGQYLEIGSDVSACAQSMLILPGSGEKSGPRGQSSSLGEVKAHPQTVYFSPAASESNLPIAEDVKMFTFSGQAPAVQMLFGP